MNASDINSAFSQDGDFTVSGVVVDDIVEQYGSPIYVYDASIIRDQYQKLRRAVPDGIDIFYAMKPNPTRAIVELLHNSGTGVEVASIGDLITCEQIGVNPNNIAYAGPAKTDQELRKAIDMGIYIIHAESLNEIKRINKIAKERNKIQQIGLRINTNFEIHDTHMSMSGKAKKFGIDESEMSSVIETSLHLENINLIGIHVYSATGILSADEFMLNMRKSFETAERANQQFKVRSVDFGGGFGVDYTNERKFDMNYLASKIASLIEEFQFIEDNKSRLITEPGRYLVAESGIYITKVIDRKTSNGENMLNCDGGIHQFLRTALIGSRHPIFNLTRRSDTKEQFEVGGNLCTPIDQLGENIELPADTQAGDLIGIFLAGAYGYTAAMLYFLNNPLPPELLIDSGKTILIRKPTSIEDLLETQSSLKEN